MKRGSLVVLTKPLETDGYDAGDIIEVTEVIYEQTAYKVAKDDLDRKAIYVDVGNGWQKKIYSDQYICIDGLTLQEEQALIKQIEAGVFA